MDYILQDIFTSYGLSTIIIAILVCLARLTLERFYQKLPKLLITYIPFILAILLNYLFDMIFISKCFIIKSNIFYSGLVSGSLSAIIYSRIKKSKDDNLSNTTANILIIKSILKGYIDQSILTQTAQEIDALISAENGLTNHQSIIDTLKKACKNLSAVDLGYLARLIISAVNSINKP